MNTLSPRYLLTVLLAVCLSQLSTGASTGLESATPGLSPEAARLLETLQQLYELLIGERPPSDAVALELLLRLIATAVGDEVAARAECLVKAVLTQPELEETARETLETAQRVWELYQQREQELAACEQLGTGLLPSVASALQRTCALNVQATTGADLNAEYARLSVALARLRLLLDPALRCLLAVE